MIGRVCPLLLVLVFMISLCQGARIIFSANPTTISSGVTPTFTVRCALEEEGSIPNTVKRVSTIIIRKVEDSIQRDVARINYGQPAAAGSWSMGARVSGELQGKVGYLQASWSSPGHLQAGAYSCEIVAVEADDTNIKFRSTIHVSSTGQTIDDLDKLLSQTKDELEALKNAFNDLKKNSPECRREINDLKNAFSDLKNNCAAACQSEIDNLKRTVLDLNTNIGLLSSTHNEGGFVVCQNSDSWGELMKYRERVQQVSFSTAYMKIPQVDISLVKLDLVTQKNARYEIVIKDLTTTGFKVVCNTWWDTTIHLMTVRWTSRV